MAFRTNSTNYAEIAAPVSGFPCTVVHRARFNANVNAMRCWTMNASGGAQIWSNPGLLCYYLSGTNSITQAINDGSTLNNSSGFFAQNVWLTIACVYASATDRTIYVVEEDGTLHSANMTSSQTFAEEIDQLVLGALQTSETVDLEDIGVLSVAATQSEVQRLAAGYRIPGVWASGVTPFYQRWEDEINAAGDTGTVTVTGSPTQVAGPTLSDLPAPVLHYKFDEGSGTTAIDSSGAGRDGTLVNGPTYVPGIVGSHALEFEAASSQEVSFSRVEQGPVSYLMWVRLATLSGTHGLMGQAGFASLAIRIENNGTRVRVTSSSNFVTDLASALDVGRWYHLAIVFEAEDGGTAVTHSYLDGQLLNTGSVNGAAPRVDTVGRVSASEFLDGALDDVRIYPFTLTQSQIQAVRAEGLNRIPTLANYYRRLRCRS